jgi:DNA-binding MarR family transcriptional regulator
MGGVSIGSLDNVAGSLLLLIAYIKDNFFRTFEQKTRTRLSHAQHQAVSILCRKGSLSMSELAHEMMISKQQLTPLVCKLLEQGLLVRRADENDRRIVRLEISDQGRKTIMRLINEGRQDLMKRLSVLPASEMDELERMLIRILEILKNVE